MTNDFYVIAFFSLSCDTRSNCDTMDTSGIFSSSKISFSPLSQSLRKVEGENKRFCMHTVYPKSMMTTALCHFRCVYNEKKIIVSFSPSLACSCCFFLQLNLSRDFIFHSLSFLSSFFLISIDRVGRKKCIVVNQREKERA